MRKLLIEPIFVRMIIYFKQGLRSICTFCRLKLETWDGNMCSHFDSFSNLLYWEKKFIHIILKILKEQISWKKKKVKYLWTIRICKKNIIAVSLSAPASKRIDLARFLFSLKLERNFFLKQEKKFWHSCGNFLLNKCTEKSRGELGV